MDKRAPAGSQLKRKILLSVSALIGLCVLATVFSLYRVTEVRRSLDIINRVSLPLGRVLVQLKSDAEVYKREFERRLGTSSWQDLNWKPRAMPAWIGDLIASENDQLMKFMENPTLRANENWRVEWQDWQEASSYQFHSVSLHIGELQKMLANQNQKEALRLHYQISGELEQWIRKLNWATSEYDRFIKQVFFDAEKNAQDLRFALQMVLASVVIFSLLLFWQGEKALRPLTELTNLAREITRRGLKREDKIQIASAILFQNDEISELAREFHRMATALLEREKTVENQKANLEEQNRLLREMGVLREKLRNSEHLAAIGRMSAQVAHEVRNPLHSIGLEADLALEYIGREDRISARQSLQSILSSVDRLETLTQNYLKFSRLSHGGRRPVQMTDVIQTVLSTYASQFEAKGIAVNWSFEPKGATFTISGDEALLEQAIGNLIRNSIEAIEDCKDPPADWEPRISIRLTQNDSGRIGLRIEDNGPGIDQDILERIFTPFLTTKAQGTGLGLAFVKKVIEDHLGQVRIEGTNDTGLPSPLPSTKRGACFVMELNRVLDQVSDQALDQENKAYVENTLSG